MSKVIYKEYASGWCHLQLAQELQKAHTLYNYFGFLTILHTSTDFLIVLLFGLILQIIRGSLLKKLGNCIYNIPQYKILQV